MTAHRHALMILVTAACGGGRGDDCPVAASTSLLTYPADGATVESDTWVKVLGATSAELYPVAGESSFPVSVDESRHDTPLGPVVVLRPGFSLADDAEYEVRIQGDVAARFRTSWTADGPSSRPTGPPTVLAVGAAEVPCCGRTCAGGGVVEIPWEGDSMRDLVLVDVLEQVNGVCGPGTQRVETLAFEWPGDGDDRLVSGLPQPLTGCYLLRVHASGDRAEETLGPVCVEGASFSALPPSDPAACSSSDGCTASPGSNGGADVRSMLLVLFAGLLVLTRRRRER